MSSDVARVIEKELKTIELVRRVVSTSNDESAVVTVEFEYQKGLDSAATDVSNSLNKIRPLLPAGYPPLPGLQGLVRHAGGHDPVADSAGGFSPGPVDDSPARRQPHQGALAAGARASTTSRSSAATSRSSRVTLDPDRMQAFRLTSGTGRRPP